MIPLRTIPNPAFKIVQPLPRLVTDPLRQGFNRKAANTSTEPSITTPQKPKGAPFNAPQISMPDIRIVIS
jgi:hypothetical protein